MRQMSNHVFQHILFINQQHDKIENAEYSAQLKLDLSLVRGEITYRRMVCHHKPYK